jgi:hypothetical protein
MKRLPFALFALAVTGTLLNGAAVHVEPSAPPATLTAVKAAVASKGAVTGSFTESRKFPFKKTPTMLRGESDFLPGRGLILKYTAPEKRTLGLTGVGIIEHYADGSQRLRSLPRQYESMLAIYDLDIVKLADDYDLNFDGSAEDWTLRLDERPSPAVASRHHEEQGGLAVITLRGSSDNLKTIEIVKPGALTITIEILKSRALTADEIAADERLLKP